MAIPPVTFVYDETVPRDLAPGVQGLSVPFSVTKQRCPTAFQLRVSDRTEDFGLPIKDAMSVRHEVEDPAIEDAGIF